MQIQNWDDLKLFLAVARTGRLSQAAKILGLDHSTVTRRMSVLEADLDVRLIERSPRGVVLTESGIVLRNHAERMEAELFNASNHVFGRQGQIAGAVRLATPEAFGSFFVAPNVFRLVERHPKIELELAPESRSVSLSRREADLAVSLNRPTEGRLKVQKLTDYSLGLYASEAYLKRHGPVVDGDDLSHHHMVWYIDDLIDWPELKSLSQVFGSTHKVFRSSSIAAQQSAVAAGLGLGLLHRFAAETDPRLVAVLPETIRVERTYWLIIHADQSRIPRVRAVADFLTELVKDNRRKFSSSLTN